MPCTVKIYKLKFRWEFKATFAWQKGWPYMAGSTAYTDVANNLGRYE
jgi:hypothetical protein